MLFVAPVLCCLQIEGCVDLVRTELNKLIGQGIAARTRRLEQASEALRQIEAEQQGAAIQEAAAALQEVHEAVQQQQLEPMPWQEVLAFQQARHWGN